MAETYELTGYADGGAVKSALDKAGTALQAGDVVNALNSTETAKPLSAAQGKALNEAITRVTAATGATSVYLATSFGGF